MKTYYLADAKSSRPILTVRGRSYASVCAWAQEEYGDRVIVLDEHLMRLEQRLGKKALQKITMFFKKSVDK